MERNLGWPPRSQLLPLVSRCAFGLLDCLHPARLALKGLVLQELDMRDQGEHQKYSPLQGYMTFLDALHIEANSGDGARTNVSAWTPR
jgi:hypothetical protein